MEIELKHQEEKLFFSRQEYVFDIKGENTPSYPQMKTEIAKKLNAKEELVMIKKVEHQFGKKNIIVKVYVYNSKEDIKKYENVKEEKPAEGAEAKPAA